MATTNINQFLFTRTQPKKKLEVINALSKEQLLSVTYSTVLRIIKEAGVGDSSKKRSKYKTLYLKKAGNNWNSNVTYIYNWKKDEIFLNVYIQGDDTDTDVTYKLKDFLDNRYEEQCLGHIEESWSYGYSHRKPANYDRADRARVIMAILVAYIMNKYADKIKQS